MTSATDKIQTVRSLEQLIVAQLDYQAQISKIWTNFKKLPHARRTSNAVQSRLAQLDQFWEALLRRHDEILMLSTTEQRQTLDYFTKDSFACIIATIDEVKDSFNELQESASTAVIVKNVNVTLPPINLPKFAGEMTAWPGFRDLFTSLVESREDLTNVQKLHYLKASLEGEAAQILKNTEVTESNFKTAWELMQKRYGNPRAILYAHLDRFLALPKVGPSRARDLRQLRDNAHEIYHAILGLQRPIDAWEDQFVHFILSKLDARTRHEWELTQREVSAFPTFAELDEDLSFRIRALESAGSENPSSTSGLNAQREGKRSTVKIHQVTSNKLPCFVCQGEHPLFQCQTFTSKPVLKRIEWIRSQDRCTNCFRRGHRAKQCMSGNVCRVCKGRHHTLLHCDHFKQSSSTNSVKRPGQIEVGESASSPSLPEKRDVSNNCAGVHASYTLLPTATVTLCSSSGRTLKVRALLDQGSQATFISEGAVQLLKSKRRDTAVSVSGIGTTRLGAIRQATVIDIQSCTSNEVLTNVNALILPKLSAYLPPPSSYSFPAPSREAFNLAEQEPYKQTPIQLLIGADYYGACLREGLIRGPPGAPVAQLTIFGWILSGKVPDSSFEGTRLYVNHVSADEDVLQALSKFWELEEPPKVHFPTDDERRCEEHFVATHVRLPDGRFVVRLPFKSAPPITFGDSKTGALKLYIQQEKRLSRNPTLSGEYSKFLQEYHDLHHMERVPFEAENNESCFYLPHHAVVKASSTTTKVRVVFNASFKAKDGISLNDRLLVGPKLQADLPGLLLKWRGYCVVYTADLEKMFRQLLLHPEDVDFQRILWRPTPQDSIQSYRLLTVTYGTASAPYLANRALKQLASDEQHKFPLGAQVLRDNVYVDDLMFGADDCETLQGTRRQLTLLLRAGGFRPYKWAANHEQLLLEIPEADLASRAKKVFTLDSQLTVLGINWEPNTDTFRFQLREVTPVKSKREFLSLLAHVFDPHGWAAPVTISAKILLQSFWHLKTGWDDALPDSLVAQCRQFQEELPVLNEVSIPRWTGQYSGDQNLQLHGFCDASNTAYAAVVYLRLPRTSGEATTSLLFAKTKVAPIKIQSIPRLELCAAHLLIRSLKFVCSHLSQPLTIHCWSDSTVVLSWLQSHPSRWKTFVANRVSVIQSEFPLAKWRHVPTAQNPADCASRGISARQLRSHPLWWHGPYWLRQASSDWPTELQSSEENAVLSESKSRKSFHVYSDVLHELVERTSSWPRLLRITCYVFRFVKRARFREKIPIHIHVLASEVRDSTEFWVSYVQKQHFHDEISELSKLKDTSQRRTLRNLHIFRDKGGILRIGGRLRNSNLPFSEKFPALMPRCKISVLLARHAHEETLHGGVQVTLRYLRQTFWIINGRSLVKQICFKCVTCARQRAELLHQQMGDLPSARVTQSRPFTHTGIDYAGPFLVRSSKGRGIKTHKAYCVIFVCLAVRAIHLECADDATTTGFLAAFDRFTSRRGLPSNVYSDNGTNFVGAARNIAENYNEVITDPLILSKCATDGIDWQFNPPAAPHFGGLWEAGVKSVKYHLRRVIGNFTPSYEEFSTLLCKIEGILNSRPIAPLYDDPESLDVLTPGHFLVGSYLRTVPKPSVLSVDENRLDRWQTVQKLYETFWKIWASDYLNSLQQRLKWRKTSDNLQINDIVLLKSHHLPPAKWELGRVTRCYYGQDGLVRVVLVRTASSEYRRPITQLCKLPVDSRTERSPAP